MELKQYKEEYIRGLNTLHLVTEYSNTTETEVNLNDLCLEDFFGGEVLAGFPFAEDVWKEIEAGYPVQESSDVYRLFSKIVEETACKADKNEAEKAERIRKSSEIAKLFLMLCWYKAMKPQEFYAAVFTAYVCYEMDYRLLSGDLQEIRRELDEIQEEENIDGFSEENGDLYRKDEMAILKLAVECRQNGIAILPPDINRSDPYEFRCEGAGIRMPFDFPYHELFWLDVKRLCKRRNEKQFLHMEEVKELLPETEVLDLANNRSLDVISEVYSGMKELDEATGGFLPGNLYVLAGRPGIGKTFFLKELSGSIGRTQHKAVKYYCHEKPLWTPEEPGILVQEIGTDFQELEQRLRKEPEVGILMIDGFEYVNPFINPVGYISLNRAEVNRRLKQIALDRGVPIIVTASVGRSLEARADRHPKLGDIPAICEGREYVDGIIAIYREGYYVPNGGTSLELQILKNPGKEVCSIKLELGINQ